jgi:hypothetical protein
MRNPLDKSSFAQCLDRSLKGRLHLPLGKSILTKAGKQPGMALRKPARRWKWLQRISPIVKRAAWMLVTTEFRIAQVLRRLPSTRGK